MGWFGKGAMDGDIGMDFRTELFGFLSLNLETDSDQKIKDTFESKSEDILNWIRDWDWDSSHPKNPGLYQSLYIQALFQLFIDYNAYISKRMFEGGKVFIIEDAWAKKDSTRKEAMQLLLSESLALTEGFNNEK